MAIRLLFVLLLLPADALAHGDGHAKGGLEADSIISAGLICALVVWHYVGLMRLTSRRSIGPGASPRDIALFGAAIISLAIALVWPLEAWAGRWFAAHMSQHMLLVTLCAVLLIASHTSRPLLAAFGRRGEIVLHRVMMDAAGAAHRNRMLVIATLIQAIILWFWHIPAAFELSLRSDAVHVLEHATLLGSALYFWFAVRLLCRTMDGMIASLAAILVTVIHSGMLGGLITFAGRPLYSLYEHLHGGEAALADQQLAGLIMWVPASVAYILPALWVLDRLIRRSGDTWRRGVIET